MSDDMLEYLARFPDNDLRNTWGTIRRVGVRDALDAISALGCAIVAVDRRADGRINDRIMAAAEAEARRRVSKALDHMKEPNNG